MVCDPSCTAGPGCGPAVVAGDGRRALELAATYAFDLVLLDILIPELNGFEVLQTLKADPLRRDIPDR